MLNRIVNVWTAAEDSLASWAGWSLHYRPCRWEGAPSGTSGALWWSGKARPGLWQSPHHTRRPGPRPEPRCEETLPGHRVNKDHTYMINRRAFSLRWERYRPVASWCARSPSDWTGWGARWHHQEPADPDRYTTSSEDPNLPRCRGDRVIMLFHKYRRNPQINIVRNYFLFIVIVILPIK